MSGRLYGDTEWLPSIILVCTAACFAIVAAVTRLSPLLPPAGILMLMAVSLYWRTTVTFDELAVRFGIWGITVFKASRVEVQSAEVYGRRWDGVNWPVRRIRDVTAQGGGKERGVLIRSTKGDFWVQSRRPEGFVQALAKGWGLPAGS
jgi:hypothetical protein